MAKTKNWNRFRDGLIWGAGISTAAIAVGAIAAGVSRGVEALRRRAATA